MYGSKFSVEFGLRPNSTPKWAKSAIPASRPMSTPRISSFFSLAKSSLVTRKPPSVPGRLRCLASRRRCALRPPPRLPPVLRGRLASRQRCVAARLLPGLRRRAKPPQSTRANGMKRLALALAAGSGPHGLTHSRSVARCRCSWTALNYISVRNCLALGAGT